MNITVGTISSAFSTSTAIIESWFSKLPITRMASEAIQGIVTRWKKRRMLAKKKLKLSDSSAVNDSLTTG